MSAKRIPGRFSDLGARLISALVLAALALALIWLGGLWTAALAGLTGAAILAEFLSITRAGRVRCHLGGLIAFAGVGGTGAAAALWSAAAGTVWLGWSLLVAVGTEWARGRAREALWVGVGTAYVGSAALGLVYLRENVANGLMVLLWLVTIVVAADVGAYFAGRLLGGPRLWPRVSPGKTWSGALAGLAAAALAGSVVARAVGNEASEVIAYLSAALAVVSQLGDLAESALKRHFGVKDSGSLLPGHGGLLDRFDSLMPVVITVALAAWAGGGRVAGW